MAKDLIFAVDTSENCSGASLDASSKSTAAVSKLLKVWENRQAQQAARIGGLGLMAVSLAACGGTDDTPYSQDDVDALDDEIASLTTERDELQDAIDDATAAIEAAGADDLADLIAERDQLVEDLETAEEEIAALELARTELLADLAPFTSATITLNDDLVITLDGANALTATNLTLLDGDVIIDVSSADSDSLTIAATAGITAGAVVQGYEAIVINNTSNTVLSHALDGVADGTVTINNSLTASATGATVTGAGNITVVAGTGVTGTLTVGMTAAAATIVNSGAASAVTVTAGAATDTITVVAADDIDLTANTARTLAISGSGDVTLLAASTLVAGATSSITGTAGQNLIVADVTDVVGTSVTGFDSVSFSGAVGGASDLTRIASPIELQLLNSSITVANNASVTSSAAGTLTLTAANDATATVVTQTANVTLGAAHTTFATNASATADVINILNVTVEADQAALAFTTASATTINLSGASDVVIDAAHNSPFLGSVLNASNLSGNLTVSAAANLLSITGGSGDDTITAIAGATVVGGNGSDTLVLGGAVMTGATFSGFETLSGAGSFLSSQLNGLEASVVGNGPGAISIGALGVVSNVIDLSDLTFANAANGVTMANATQNTAVILADSAMTITGSNGADVLLGFGGADVISGGLGNDLITGGAGADTLTGGEGADVITGGAGADIINLSETVSAADVVVIATADGSAVGTVGGTFSGFDVITGFVTGTDAVDVTVVDTDAGNDNVVVVAQTGATTAANDLADAAFANVDAVVAFLNDGGATLDASETSVVAITFSDFTALYSIANDGTAAVAVGELRLLGTVDAILVAADIIA